MIFVIIGTILLIVTIFSLGINRGYNGTGCIKSKLFKIKIENEFDCRECNKLKKCQKLGYVWFVLILITSLLYILGFTFP